MAHRGAKCAAVVALVIAAGVGSGCSHPGDFIWVDQVPKSMTTPDSGPYRLRPGDVIGVKVWGQEANSIDRTRVREDGKISVPFLNDVDVVGMEPGELARRLEVKFKAYIQNPVVTVIVHDRRPLRVSVVGQVARPGVYDLDDDSGVVHALAAAGGMTPFAHDDRVFVIRNGYWQDNNAPARIRFRYDDLRSGKVPAALFLLRRGDIVVVE